MPPAAILYLWDYYTELMPIPRDRPFMAEVHAWSASVGVSISRTEMHILKTLYQRMLYRADNPVPEMLPATDDNLKAMLIALADAQKNKK